MQHTGEPANTTTEQLRCRWVRGHITCTQWGHAGGAIVFATMRTQNANFKLTHVRIGTTNSFHVCKRSCNLATIISLKSASRSKQEICELKTSLALNTILLHLGLETYVVWCTLIIIFQCSKPLRHRWLLTPSWQVLSRPQSTKAHSLMFAIKTRHQQHQLQCALNHIRPV